MTYQNLKTLAKDLSKPADAPLALAIKKARLGTASPNIYAPAGTYRFLRQWHLEGEGIRLYGDGPRTIFHSDHNFTGTDVDGMAGYIRSTLAPEVLPVAVTGRRTIETSATVKPGERLLLTAGRGACARINAARGGQARAFHELAPCEIVTVAAVLGNVATLTAELIGEVGHYAAPAFAEPDPERRPHLRRFAVLTIGCEVRDIGIRMSRWGDVGISMRHTDGCKVRDVTILEEPEIDHGGQGGIAVVGCQRFEVSGFRGVAKANVGVNSSCLGRVVGNYAPVVMEEGCAGIIVRDNAGPVRIGDVTCERIIVSGNLCLHGRHGVGAMAINEGHELLIAGNLCAGGSADLWTGPMKDSLVAGNLAGAINAFAVEADAPAETYQGNRGKMLLPRK